MNFLSYFFELQKRFKISTPFQLGCLTLGGVLLCIYELVGISIIFPIIMILLDPTLIQSNIFLSKFYNYSTFQSPQSFVIALSFIVVLVYGIKTVFHILLWRYEFKLLCRWRLKMSTSIFNAVMHAPFKRIAHENSSRFIGAITNIIPLTTLSYIHQVIYLIQTAIISAVFLAYIVSINPKLFLGMSLFGGFVVLSFNYIQKKNLRLIGHSAQAHNKEQILALQQAISGYKETKIHQKEALFTDRFEDISKKMSHSDTLVRYIQHLPIIVIEFLAIMTLFTAFGFILIWADDLQAKALEISMIAVLIVRMIPLLNRAATSLSAIRSTIPMIEELLNIFDALHENILPKSEKIMSTLSFQNKITLSDISFKHEDQENFTLHNITIHIPKGAHIGIVGPSGSGKTTLVNILLGFYTSHTGLYKIDDTSITDKNISQMRQLISCVEQNPFMLDDTIIKNVTFGDSIDKVDMRRVLEVLKSVGLLEYTTSLKSGLQTRIGEKGQFLSGGQRQRLAIARALYKNASILILDEASSALDIESENNLIELIDSIRDKITIISIAHRLSTLRNCDSLVFLSDANIAATGSFSDIYNKNATFRNYVDSSNIKIDEVSSLQEKNPA